MKRVFRLFILVLVLAVALTLSQASTFYGVWLLEMEFWKYLLVNPLSMLGTISIWKYGSLLLSMLLLLVCGVARLFKRKSPKVVESLAKPVIPEPVGSMKEVTSSPSKFKRVVPKQ